MKETNKWSVRDVITTVLLSAVLIVIQLVVNMVCMANVSVNLLQTVLLPCHRSQEPDVCLE